MERRERRRRMGVIAKEAKWGEGEGEGREVVCTCRCVVVCVELVVAACLVAS